jgi:hypothetical protein
LKRFYAFFIPICLPDETHILEVQSELYKPIIKGILQAVFIQRQIGTFWDRYRQFLDILALQKSYLQEERWWTPDFLGGSRDE